MYSMYILLQFGFLQYSTSVWFLCLRLITAVNLVNEAKSHERVVPSIARSFAQSMKTENTKQV